MLSKFIFKCKIEINLKNLFKDYQYLIHLKNKLYNYNIILILIPSPKNLVYSTELIQMYF